MTDLSGQRDNGALSALMRASRPLAIICGAAAWIIGAAVGRLTGWELGLWALVGATLTAAAAGLPLLASARATKRAVSAEQLAEEATARYRLVLHDALEPLAHLLGRITDQPRRLLGRDHAELQGQATVLVLVAASEVLTGNRLRACFFELAEGRPRRLTPAGYHGRNDPPTTVFVEGTVLGDQVFALLDQRTDRYVRDVGTEPPVGWEGLSRVYRAFIAVPVATEDRTFGLLTVDALTVEELTEDDVAAVRVMARLLAVALNA
jgi:GAF domain-containing protein